MTHVHLFRSYNHHLVCCKSYYDKAPLTRWLTFWFWPKPIPPLPNATPLSNQIQKNPKTKPLSHPESSHTTSHKAIKPSSLENPTKSPISTLDRESELLYHRASSSLVVILIGRKTAQSFHQAFTLGLCFRALIHGAKERAGGIRAE